MKKFLGIFLSIIVLTSAIFVVGCDNNKEKISTYKIDCTLEGNKLIAKQQVEFYNHTENAFSSLKFNLYGNAFRENAKYKPISDQYLSKAYYNGQSYGDIQIEKVYGKEGDLQFSIVGEDENVLEITLLEQVFPAERVCVWIEYTLTLANVIARTGVNEKTINLANFYPILCGISNNSFYECVYFANGDPFFSDCANYNVTFACDEEFVVASSGELKSSTKENGRQKNTYILDNARSFAFVLSKDFECVTDQKDGVEINYYFYKDALPGSSIKTARESIDYFSNIFGKYPYKKYSVVQTRFIQGGMEFPGLCMISDELEQKSYTEVIVHETAHQWWQTAVGNNEVEYGFLDEGLTEYSVVLFYENHSEYGIDRKTLIKSSENTYKMFCSIYDKLFGNVNTSMKRGLREFSSEYEYVNIAYVKPCLMFDGIRNSVGDEIFFKALKNYYENYKFLNATPDDMVSEFEKLVKDSSGYFESFFSGQVIL